MSSNYETVRYLSNLKPSELLFIKNNIDNILIEKINNILMLDRLDTLRIETDKYFIYRLVCYLLGNYSNLYNDDIVKFKNIIKNWILSPTNIEINSIDNDVYIYDDKVIIEQKYCDANEYEHTIETVIAIDDIDKPLNELQDIFNKEIDNTIDIVIAQFNDRLLQENKEI